MSFKVLARPDLPTPLAEELLAKAGLTLVKAPIFTEEDLIQNAADADAVLVGGIEPYTARVIRSMKKCKIISRSGIGYNNIDAEEATRQGIPVAIVPDASVQEVSDHVMAFMLAFSRKLFPLAQAVRDGRWVAGSPDIIRRRGKIFRLSEQTLGIVGVGRIGTQVAQKARAFGMRVLGYDPYLTAEEMERRGARKVDWDFLLRESDYVSINAPLTSETRHMFNGEAFRRMKPSAILINTARGGIVDEKALYRAIVEGMIGGAGLDVTDPEPPARDNPMLKLDQVLITAHSAFYSETSVEELYRKSIEAILMALRGEWPPTLANPEVRRQSNRRIP